VEFLAVKDLGPTPWLDRALYEPTTGRQIFDEGEALAPECLDALRASGIDLLAALAPGETPRQLVHRTAFRQVELRQLPAGAPLPFDLRGGDGTVLLARGTRLEPDVLARLEARGVRRALIPRRLPRDMPERLRRLDRRLADLAGRTGLPPVRFEDHEVVEDPALYTPIGLRRLVTAFERNGGYRVRPEKTRALLARVRAVNPLAPRPELTRRGFVGLHDDAIGRAEQIFHLLHAGLSVNATAVGELTHHLVSGLVTDRDLLLGTLTLPARGDYLVRHAVNVAILATNIAAALGYSLKQVTEVGYGAFLSDVGMLRIEDEIRYKNGPLGPRERLEVMRHAYHGIRLLGRIGRLPRTAPLVAYQVHERSDGTGYPEGRRGSRIHDYAKVVAVADIYHAQVAPRPHRTAPRKPYRAVEQILRMSAARKLDARFVRGLLSILGLFPVGSWVRLDTGELARVLSAHPKDYTRPVVAVLYSEEGQPLPPRRIDLLRTEDLRILSAEEVRDSDPMAGF
jgi:HD-GYP domain-containing protein (c-di-GMP phosphodiesterase class II)